MGCLPSKLGTDDSVSLCKDRRRQMKKAISALHDLAAAHSDYLLSLKQTGLALSTFAAGEPLSVADQTPTGQTPASQTTDGQTLDGQTTDGQTLDGQTAAGQTSAGQTLGGQTTAGQTLDGQTTDGQTFDGQTAAGQTHAGQTLDVQITDGQTLDGQTTDGQTLDGQTPVLLPTSSTTTIPSSKPPPPPLRPRSPSVDCGRASLTSSEDEMEHDDEDFFDPTSELESRSASGSSTQQQKAEAMDLVGTVRSIKDYFDEAADKGTQVSEMLSQDDPSGMQVSELLPKHEPVGGQILKMLAKLDPSDSKIRLLLDVILDLEEKLYKEVKERGLVEIKRAELSAALRSMEHKGKDESKLKKTKASIKKLDSQILATSTAVSAFYNAIVIVQGAKLGPQLVKLCQGFVFMWKFMNQNHEVQRQVIQQVQGLVNRVSTSDLRLQTTRELEAAVSAWHASFCRLIKFQSVFIKSLHGWLQLNLLPINMEETSVVYVVLDKWNLALEHLSYTTTFEAASKAIESFIKDVQLLSSKQVEEMKVKKRIELASKELEKKASSLRSSIEKKYCHSNSMVGIGLPGSGQDEGHGLVARDPLSKKKGELEAFQRRIEEEIRARTLDIIQGLSGVFQAMTKFSLSIKELLEDV